MNNSIAHLYDPFNPAILRLIKIVVDNAHKAGIWVGMCGEATADPMLVPVLLGLGLDELSINASSILRMRKAINEYDRRALAKYAEEALALSSPEEIKKFIQSQLV